MPVYPSGGTIAQSVGSPGFGPAPAPVFNASASVRFNPADTPSFGYIPTLQGSRTTFTLSVWVKRSALGVQQIFFGQNTDSNNHGFFEFQANDTLRIASNLASSTVIQLITTQFFRDPSQWYNIVFVFDLTNATQADRVRLFVNGVRVTAFSTSTLPANTTTTTTFNAAGVQHYIGRYAAASSFYYGGYLADMNFVDGLALTPSSFTATDANTGQLVPAQYTGSFGLNGFYLPLSSAALAVDLGQNPKTTAKDFPYWPYNTLLVDTTSTNGAQNNTFLDSSTNNFTVTRNGNTTQGNFTPFTFGGGTTQANGYYSGYFDGTGDYLSLPASGNASYINGTGNFTIDFWVYYNALPTGSVGANTGCSWYAQDSGLTIVSPFNLIQAGNTWYLYADTGAGTWNIFSQVTIATTTLSSGQWYHVACVRDSTNIRLYINGVQVGTASIGAASIWQNTVRNLYLFGAWQNTAGSTGLNGYVSNYRLVKGTCLYPNGTTFTVPTTPLTAITNTSLLTCQSSQFIDNSTNAFAITANGNAQPLPTNPFGMTAWSGYFDGTGDYLSVGDQSAFEFGSGNYTVECWWFATTSADQNLIGKWDGGGSEWILQWRNAGYFRWAANGGVISDATISLSLNTWNHIAVSKSGTSLRIFVNGIQTNTTATEGTISATSASLTIAVAQLNSTPLYTTGQLSNIRIVKGTALYTANFTVPTTPLTAVTNTSLLTCQSSQFIDNSANAFPITVNGNSYTGTLNNPFGNPINYTTPPVQAWSTYFDGSGDYISTTPTALTYGIGTNLFTWESWIYTVNSSATAQGIWHYYTTVTDIIYPYIVSSTGTFNCQLRATNQALTTISAPAGSIRLNQWHHVVVTRDSATNISLYVDGKKVAGGTIAASTSFADTVMNTTNGNNPVIGAQTNTLREYFYGYISNVRFVRGSAVYTGNFTPPTAPLTAVPGTMTLACQSNRVRDNSIVNAAQVANGNTAISPVSPFIPTQPYTAASYGGSMYFDGTGDYLTIPSTNPALSFGTGDFTIEMWVFKPTATNAAFLDARAGATATPWFAGVDASNFPYFYSGVSYTSSVPLVLNAWNHVVFVRTSSVLKIFVNGVQGYSASYTVNLDRSAGLVIGESIQLIAPLLGYISNLRIVKGTALYTTTFVPPVLPQTAVANTQLLMNATNSGVYDSTGQNVIETAGNVQVTTAVKKFGESSISFDGSGDYLLIPATNAPCQFGTADFTIEAWIYSTSIGNQQMILSNRIAATGTTNFGLQIYQSKVRMGNQNVDYLVGAITLSSNTWYHVAVSRISGTFRLFINGVLDVASVSAQTMSSNAITVCGGDGSYSPTSYPFVGYIQDLRISKVGRYSGNFTPPAAAFAYNQYDIGNQQWLPTNISVTAGVNQDNLVDSPSDFGTDTGLGGQVRGNYCTWNPLKNSTTLSNGNLSSFNSSTSQWLGVSGTFGMTSGQWYWECTPIVGATAIVGLANSSYNTGGHPGADANSWGYYSANGFKYFNNSGSSYGTSYTANDVIGVAFDADAGTLTFYKNGVSQGVAFSGLTSGPYFPACGVLNSQNININAGQRAFSFTAPAGFKCLVSTNLPTTNGIGATSTTRASNYFNANIWTGNGTQIPVGFDPSLIWYKATNSVSGAGWVDQIRGDNYYMQTYNTLASTLLSGLLTTNSTGFVPGSAFASNTYVGYSWRGADTLAWSFDGSLERTATMTIASPCVVTLASNGFSAGQAVRFTTTGALPTGIVAGTTYYAGNMVGSTFNLYDTEANAITGGATGRVNTSGSQSGTQTCEHAARISANPTSGFSVTQYIGVGGTTTVPHGLGAAPEMYIIKSASTTGNWLVLTTALDGSVDYAYFNGQQNLTNAGAGFSTLPTSTVVSLGIDQDANTNGVTYMLYSYVSIPGFSKVGVYTGNGSADGPMIYTNFSPKMLILKRVTGTPIDSWYMLDEPRSPYNVVSNFLGVNSDQAQGTATFVDFLSNGFKPRVASGYANASGAAYLYIAVASAPFKYSRAY